MAANRQLLKLELNPLSVLRALWKGKFWILAIVGLGAAAATYIVHSLPAIYRSEALILVDTQKIPERYVASTVNTEVQDRLMTIRQQILSTTRLLKIIENFNLYRDERKSMSQEEVIEKMRLDISVNLEKGWTRDRPGAFRVGYTGRNPALITEVANQLAGLFIDENIRTREKQANGTAEFIDSQLQEAKKALDDLEAKVSQYKISHNGELPQQETSLAGTLSRLQVELQGNQDGINRAQQNKVMLQSALSMAEASESALARALEQRPNTRVDSSGRIVETVVPKKRSELLQAQYDALSLRYKPGYKDMIALQKEIDRQKKLEETENAELAAKPKLTGTATPEATPEVPQNPLAQEQLRRERERVENIKTQLSLLEKELAQRNTDRERILKSISQYTARLERLPVREQEMAAVTRDYELQKLHYKSLLDKKLSAGMATDMEHRMQAEKFTLLDPARVPEKPISPNRPFLRTLGIVISLGLALGLVFVKDLRSNRVQGEWELPAGVAVLGRVPFIRITGPGTTHHKKRRLRLALISTTLAAVVVCAAGAYMYWRA
jgi:polysaccharide chain length determinant protein (PEP-CTERM system associated)